MVQKKRAVGPSCPLCGKPNQCGVTSGAPSCWCMRTEVPKQLIERVPDALKGIVCICEDCVKAELATILSRQEASEGVVSRE